MGKKWLNIVYKEKNSTRLKKHYREWADGYDSDLKDWGYAYPDKVKQILEKYITVKKGSKILDAGCGTGYVAEVLKALLLWIHTHALLSLNFLLGMEPIFYSPLSRF